MVNATTVGLPSSRTMARKYSERERFVASSTVTIRSGFFSPSNPITVSAATFSSGESGRRE